MKNFYRNAKLLFAVGMIFGLSKASLHDAMADHDPCAEPEWEWEGGGEFLQGGGGEYGYGYGDDDDDDDYAAPRDCGDGTVEPGGEIEGGVLAMGGSRAKGTAGHAGGKGAGGGGGGSDGGGGDEIVAQTAGGIKIFENWTLSIDGQIGKIHDAALGGDGSDTNATIWLDSFSGDWNYGLGLSYGYYRVNDRYEINIETYAADLYLSYNFNQHFYAGSFINLSYVDLHNATFTYQGGTTTVGSTDFLYGVGIFGGANYTYQKYSFNANAVLASTSKDNLGDLFDEDESMIYTSGSVYRPVTDQLAVEVFAGWTKYFERSSGRDDSYGNVGGNVIFQINDHWRASIGLETDFAQTDFEGNYLNGRLSYSW